MSALSMTIGGSEAATEATFGVVNPATGQVFEQAPRCTPEQLDAAMDSAQKAYRDWRADMEVRRECLRKIADLLFAAGGELAPILTAEQGKPLGDANVEVIGAGVWFKYFADLDVPARSSRTTPTLSWRCCGDPWEWWPPSRRGTSRWFWLRGKSRRRCWQATPWCSSHRRTRRCPPSSWASY